jgi:hypothetical protein
MKNYKGFLPIGKSVAAYVNKQELKIAGETWVIKGSGTYQDHVNLKNVSNEMAIALGVPSQTINNIMYLQGLKILKCAKAQAASSDGADEAQSDE